LHSDREELILVALYVAPKKRENLLRRTHSRPPCGGAAESARDPEYGSTKMFNVRARTRDNDRAMRKPRAKFKFSAERFNVPAERADVEILTALNPRDFGLTRMKRSCDSLLR